MSNDQIERQRQEDAMRDEYDFSGGVRGKHSQAYQRGYQVQVNKSDGTTEIRDFTLPAGTVLLDPDVRAYFPDSPAVNRALRGLISLLPPRPTSDETR